MGVFVQVSLATHVTPLSTREPRGADWVTLGAYAAGEHPWGFGFPFLLIGQKLISESKIALEID